MAKTDHVGQPIPVFFQSRWKSGGRGAIDPWRVPTPVGRCRVPVRLPTSNVRDKREANRAMMEMYRLQGTLFPGPSGARRTFRNRIPGHANARKASRQGFPFACSGDDPPTEIECMPGAKHAGTHRSLGLSVGMAEPPTTRVRTSPRRDGPHSGIRSATAPAWRALAHGNRRSREPHPE